MGDEIRLTVIATGFEGTSPKAAPRPTTIGAQSNKSQTNQQGHTRPQAPSVRENASVSNQQQRSQANAGRTSFEPRVINTEDIDIPAYLRHRYKNNKDDNR